MEWIPRIKIRGWCARCLQHRLRLSVLVATVKFRAGVPASRVLGSNFGSGVLSGRAIELRWIPRIKIRGWCARCLQHRLRLSVLVATVKFRAGVPASRVLGSNFGSGVLSGCAFELRWIPRIEIRGWFAWCFQHRLKLSVLLAAVKFRADARFSRAGCEPRSVFANGLEIRFTLLRSIGNTPASCSAPLSPACSHFS